MEDRRRTSLDLPAQTIRAFTFHTPAPLTVLVRI
jgi:hypothetical protein